MVCRVCDGEGWVCENHMDLPWGGMSDHADACDCGAGAPCWVCNTDMAVAGRVSPLVEALKTARDYVSDYALGHTMGFTDLKTVWSGGTVNRKMSESDLEGLDAAIAKATGQ